MQQNQKNTKSHTNALSNRTWNMTPTTKFQISFCMILIMLVWTYFPTLSLDGYSGMKGQIVFFQRYFSWEVDVSYPHGRTMASLPPHLFAAVCE